MIKILVLLSSEEINHKTYKEEEFNIPDAHINIEKLKSKFNQKNFFKLSET